MMRAPTSKYAQLVWHTSAIDGHEPAAHDGEPQCGFYQRKLCKGGVFVPARIWLLQHINNGQLTDDEVFLCEVNGQPADPIDEWGWLHANPITYREYKHLQEVQEWAAWHAVDQPEANPHKPVDMNTVNLPFL